MKKVILQVGDGATASRAALKELGAPAKLDLPDLPVTMPPDIAGEHGKAWVVNRERALERTNTAAEASAWLVSWVIECPAAHPLWHSYMLTLMHLRPCIPGETLIYLDGATHEIWLQAMDPRKDRTPLIKGEEFANEHGLIPLNYASQFIESSDLEASTRAAKAVMEVCAGTLNPDTDFRPSWQARFGDCMWKDRPGGSKAVKRMDILPRGSVVMSGPESKTQH